MADEAQADALFAEAWEEWLGERLVGGDDVLLDALDRGIPLEGDGWGERTSLRGLARTLLDQRDLVPRRGGRRLLSRGGARASCWRRARAAGRSRRRCRRATASAARLVRLADFAEASRFLEGDALVDHLLALEAVPSNFGFKPHWPSPEALAEGRAIAAWTKEARAAWAAARGAALHGRLVRALGGVAALYERKKAERGVLDFLDLLLKARDALRDHAGVREWYRRRFRYLVIDEFQDTDPLQVEIARLLAGDRPGALVVVGDAKQSIYRFRRAEVRLFRELTRRAETSEGGAVLHLVQNFRSRPAILRFVNRVFAELIQASEEADQPAYEAIAPPPGLSEEPSVVALRFPAPPNASGEDLLDAEASGLAAFLAGVARGSEAVRDPVTGATRPSRAGDVLVLARRLTRVQALEEALEAAGAALHRRGRQVLLRPPGGARGARGPARDRRSLGPDRARGGAALVLLRRERPRHRGLLALGRAAVGGGDRRGAARRPRRSARRSRSSRSCTGSGGTRASPPCSSGSTRRRASSPRSPARAAARRRSRTSRRWRRSRARPPRSGR